MNLPDSGNTNSQFPMGTRDFRPTHWNLLLCRLLLVLLFAGLSHHPLIAQVESAQTLVAWGESILGLNKIPTLPTGITDGDIEGIAAGEFVNAVALRKGIIINGDSYKGNRFIISGMSGLKGSASGQISPGTSDTTTWNSALSDKNDTISLNRVAFGYLHGVVILKEAKTPTALGQFPGNLRFFGDIAATPFPSFGTAPGFDGDKFIAVATSSTHALGLRSTGSVLGFGGDNFWGENSVPVSLVNAVDITAGEYFSAALIQGGQVSVWGSDDWGVVQIPPSATNIISIKAGASHLVALRADGTVVAWGNGTDGRTLVPAGLKGVKKIATGRAHTLALKDDGTVVAWGYNGSGQVSVPYGLSNVVDIAAGGNHNLALTSKDPPVIEAIQGAIGRETFDFKTDYLMREKTLVLSAQVKRGGPPIQYRWRKNGVIIVGAKLPTLNLEIPQTEQLDQVIIEVNAYNNFGSFNKSVEVKLGSFPSDISIRIGKNIKGNVSENLALWSPGLDGSFKAFGTNNSGIFLDAVGLDDPSLTNLLFEVRSKGNPSPNVRIYDALSLDLLCGPSDITGASSLASGTTYRRLARQKISEMAAGSYIVIVENLLGVSITNKVNFESYPTVIAPQLVATYSNNPHGSTFIGPVSLGATNLVLFNEDEWIAPENTLFQWLKGGAEIPGATSQTLKFPSFSFDQIAAYSLRIRTPLFKSSDSIDASKGQAITLSVIPVLPVIINLPKTNLNGAIGSRVTFEARLTGSLSAEVRLEQLSTSGWIDASHLFTINGAAWPASRIYPVKLTNSPGNATLTLAATLGGSMNGEYRFNIRQFTSVRGTEIMGSQQVASFFVSVIENALVTVPVSLPNSISGGGSWSPNSSLGTAMTVAVGAFDIIDLSAYLSIRGTPAPNIKWEKLVGGTYKSVQAFTNNSKFLVFGHPTNAGIYRVTVTNSVGGVVGVSKLITLNVDRTLRISRDIMAVPSAIFDVPIGFFGFGDESAISFSLLINSPYLYSGSNNIAFKLDAEIEAQATAVMQMFGSMVSTEPLTGVSLNQINVQILISRKDLTSAFKFGTNGLGKLTLRAQDLASIGPIRSMSPVPSVEIAVRPLTAFSTPSLGDYDIPLSVALTNATLASMGAETGLIRFLADSYEGDVDGNFAVNVADITSIVSVLSTRNLTAFQTEISRSRMDTAPFESSGDTKLDLADLVQIARYVANLDPKKPVGGPAGLTVMNRSSPAEGSKRLGSDLEPLKSRRLNFGWSDLVVNQETWVPVVLNGQGNENALSFNVEFDASVMDYIGARAAPGTALIENNIQAKSGRLGLILWRSAGTAAPAGSSVVVEIGFKVRGVGGRTTLRFGALPVDTMIATVSAESVSQIDKEAKQLNIGLRRRIAGGRIVNQELNGAVWNIEMQAIDSLGAPVSGQGRGVKVQSAEHLNGSDSNWIPSGVEIQVTPSGMLRIPLAVDPTRSMRFFRLWEE